MTSETVWDAARTRITEVNEAIRGERERIRQLAIREQATYRPTELTVGIENGPTEKPGPDPLGDPFADLLTEED